jgi:ABC-type cobalt transport system substrate-binding protein
MVQRAHIAWILVAVVAALLVMILKRPREGYKGGANKKKCLNQTEEADQKKYYYRKRKPYPGKDPYWQCPRGWKDTGCDWGIDGVSKKQEWMQCRRHKNKSALKERKGNKCKKSNDCSGTRGCYAIPGKKNGYCHFLMAPPLGFNKL